MRTVEVLKNLMCACLLYIIVNLIHQNTYDVLYVSSIYGMDSSIY